MNNSLAEVRPELVPERSEKNLPLKPDEITFGSNKKVGWIRTKRFGGTCIRKRRKNSTPERVNSFHCSLLRQQF